MHRGVSNGFLGRLDQEETSTFRSGSALNLFEGRVPDTGATLAPKTVAKSSGEHVVHSPAADSCTLRWVHPPDFTCFQARTEAPNIRRGASGMRDAVVEQYGPAPGEAEIAQAEAAFNSTGERGASSNAAALLANLQAECGSITDEASPRSRPRRRRARCRTRTGGSSWTVSAPSCPRTRTSGPHPPDRCGRRPTCGSIAPAFRRPVDARREPRVAASSSCPARPAELRDRPRQRIPWRREPSRPPRDHRPLAHEDGRGVIHPSQRSRHLPPPGLAGSERHPGPLRSQAPAGFRVVP